MYSINILRRAVKEIAALPDHYPRLIAQHIDNLGSNPRPLGSKKLEAGLGYSLRVGDYRILYRMDDRTQTVTVWRVKHRREAYR